MAKGDIELHPTLGVNPHLTYCPRCGVFGNELALIGRRTQILKCPNCQTSVIGHVTRDSCPKCGYSIPRGWVLVGHIGEHDKLPGSLCNACAKEIEENKQVVAEGGIYFKCKECKREGVIKKSAPICKVVRKKLKLKKTQPCGIEFDKCAEHTPTDDAKTTLK